MSGLEAAITILVDEIVRLAFGRRYLYIAQASVDPVFLDGRFLLVNDRDFRLRDIAAVVAGGVVRR